MTFDFGAMAACFLCLHMPTPICIALITTNKYARKKNVMLSSRTLQGDFFLFKCNIFCINDSLLYHIIEALSSVKQLCSVLGPGMEISWSGTPGAAKKV